MPKGKVPKVPTEVLAAEYDSGMTLRELSERHGISFQTIDMQLRHAGKQLRSRYTPRAPLTPVVCKGCGILFTPNFKGRLYHSHNCWITHKKGVHYKEFCVHGHPLSGDNLYCGPSMKTPRCRACILTNQAKWRKKQKEQTT